eukprot:TRINITY_DN35520_c0_g1_i1.p1 TRINITY_DN35520_c0_g1~~TRINITY_DN35520_c0_g1_i1.p1  ORF type:complete len:351 (-),score=23.44 TRINITY_DN35520_c0_g1_i1:93-1118(-)
MPLFGKKRPPQPQAVAAAATDAARAASGQSGQRRAHDAGHQRSAHSGAHSGHGARSAHSGNAHSHEHQRSRSGAHHHHRSASPSAPAAAASRPAASSSSNADDRNRANIDHLASGRAEERGYKPKGHFNAEQVRALHLAVKEIAGSSSKPIDRSTFGKIVAKFHSHPHGAKVSELKTFSHPRVFAELLFDEFDPSGTGSISWSALLDGMSVKCLGSVDERLAFAFAALNPDADGFVDRSRLKRVYVRNQRSMRRTLEHLEKGRPYDQRKPGAQIATVISEQDGSAFEAVVDRVFEEADTKRDNKLDLDEWRAWRRSKAPLLGELHTMMRGGEPDAEKCHMQ